MLVRSQPAEKRLAVYSPRASYTVSITDRDNTEYVGLIDLLEPLGKVEARGNDRWRLEFTPADASRTVELEFSHGKRRGKVRGTNVELPANFYLVGGRGYVPLSSLPNLMPRVLELTAELHQAGRRFFLGNVAIKVGAELRKNPSRLVLSFPAAVSPFIASEGNTLRLLFSREPVTGAGMEEVSYTDGLINSANFSENNGAAEMVIRGSAPLLASFSDGGKTITIAAAPQQAATTAPQPPPVQAPSAAATPQTPGETPPISQPRQPTSGARFLVMIDPGHGGEERGAALTEALGEKDVTLALARRIHRELEGRGIAASLTRNGDSTLSFDQRATISNTARASAYISVHADTLGSGVRVYTALLQPAPPAKPRAFLPWETAQAFYLDVSSALAGSIAAECNNRKIPVRAVAAAVRPLNSVTTAAISVELAPPPEGAVDDISSEKYQQSVASAVAAGVAAIRQRLESAR